MNFTPLLVKLIKSLWPLAKEYFLSNDKKKTESNLRVVTVIFGITLLICSMVSLYLAEQAKQNLTVAEPLITQFNEVALDNERMHQQIIDLQNKLFECENKTNFIINDCQATINSLKGQYSYVYDPKSKTMVLKHN